MSRNVIIEFVKHGTTPAEVPKSEIYLDVGGLFLPGVIDHHHDMGDTSFPSTARMIYSLLVNSNSSALWPTSNETAERIRSLVQSDKTIVIKTHLAPDFDAVVSCSILKRYLTTGDIPTALNDLVSEVDRVDQGEYDNNPLAKNLWYLFFWYFNNVLNTDDILRDFSTLIDQYLPKSGAVVPLVNHLEYKILRHYFESLEKQYEKIFSPTGLTVPFYNTKKSQYEPMGIIFATLDEDLKRDFQAVKILFRKKSKAIWVVYDPRDSNGHGRITLSVDGTLSDGLLGYGWVIEFFEKVLRKKLKNHRYPVRNGPVRTGYRNSDPWYDGRGHAYTIVDSPHSGTILSILIIDQFAKAVTSLNDCWPRLEHAFRKDKNTRTGFSYH